MISIRKYHRNDLKELVSVINSVCSEEKWMHTRFFEPTPEWYQAMLNQANRKHLLLVVTEKDLLFGWCRIFTHNNIGDLGIGLLEPYRNRGIGTQLLGKALEWAEQNELLVKLTCRVDNQRAMHVFRKADFVSNGINNGMFTMTRTREAIYA